MFDLSLMGRMSFKHTQPEPPPLPALPPGRNRLGIADERDAILYVPPQLDLSAPVPLLVMFHGAGGFPEKVLPFLEEHADRHRFLLLAPHSTFATWDIVIGGNGPDVERLDQALAAVAARYAIDPARLGFAGFSDGASYALSTGVTNGDVVSHVMAFSGGFMNIFMQEGSPKVFIAHGLIDEQLPIETAGRANAAKLTAAGYDVEYVEFNGKHVIQPAIVNMAIDFFLRRSL
ncbi:MAG TPA: esterase [Herbaspirillum sp.]|jgi:phospholipase/carboxylesterase